MKMTNRWNRFIYRLWAPIYDSTIGHFFLPGRRQVFDLLNLQPGERVLLVGVGTGGDLPLLPRGVQAIGVDISFAMLARARQKQLLLEQEIILLQGDAQQLLIAEGSCDVVVFNLILSVIPDGAMCLRENLRALKSGGRAVVFDKFLPESGRLTLGRRLLNLGSTIFGTDITRRFGDLAKGIDFQVVWNEPALLNGTYRVILLRREKNSQDEYLTNVRSEHR